MISVFSCRPSRVSVECAALKMGWLLPSKLRNYIGLIERMDGVIYMTIKLVKRDDYEGF